MHCMNCGTELPSSARFCSSCGTQVTADETPEVPLLAQQEETNQLTRGPSIVVEPGSLESAVREAQDGAILRLKAGEHRLSRPLVIDKPLSLIGEGMDDTRVVCDGEAQVVKFAGEGPFVVHDLSFEHQGSRWAEVVEVAGGEIDIRRCRFTGGVRDEAGQRGGIGLWLWGQTRGLVASCESVQNGLFGISIEDQAQPTLEANTCKENKGLGIVYIGSAAGTARQNVCSANEGAGIAVTDQAQPTLEANTCQENQGSGIVYIESAAGTAWQNVCSANEEEGISVGGQACPTLVANTCRQNKNRGIRYGDSSSGTARQNICSANEGVGIAVVDQAQPTLEANTCQQNRWGVGYGDSAAGIAQQNVCSANEGMGIVVTHQASPTLEANTCQENKENGIIYGGSAAGIAGQNICYGNHGSGIFVSQQAQPTLEANTCQENQMSGIIYFDSAAGIARQNVCSGNGHQGISVADQAQPTLEANTCQENQMSGIIYFDSAAGFARQNVCSGNEGNLLVAPTARPILKDNRLYLNSDQTERVLYEFPVEAILYDGRPNYLVGCNCTITDRRIIIQCDTGGTQQILLRDISKVTPEIRWFTHRTLVSVGASMTYALNGNDKNETMEIATRIEEAMMS